MIKINYIKPGYTWTYTEYSENGLLKKAPFYHFAVSGELASVESAKQPEIKQGLLERMLTNKGKSQKATVKALLSEIELRQNLNLHLIGNIDYSLSQQRTQLDNLKSIKSRYSFELAKNVYKAVGNLENNLLELEKEKRTECLECWRDLMFLKKYLMSALREYWDFAKRRELLNGKISSQY